MVSVIHFLPENGIAGAEVAACTCAREANGVKAFFLRRNTTGKSEQNVYYGTGNGVFSLSTIRAAVRAVDNHRPTALVFSLWRTFGVFIALKLLRPRHKFVLLLHSDRSVHLIDKWLTAVMARFSDAILADSRNSLRRLRNRERYHTRTVSFLLYRPVIKLRRSPKLKFIYWGRFQEVKNIPEAIRFFAGLADGREDAEFLLIGPDSGRKSDVERLVNSLGLQEKVRFLGYRRHAEIVELAQGASFFLQLSRQEGMAMSVAEAMQLGLVVVTTPVGEIANYCRDMRNGIHYDNATNTSLKIHKLLERPECFNAISTEAIDSWDNTSLYQQDFVTAIEELTEDQSREASNEQDRKM